MSDNSHHSPLEKLQARHCFVCGIDNPRGLKIPFYYNGEKVRAEFIPDSDLCGFDGIVHGGIVYSLADEAMMHLIWASGLKAITAEIVMRYHAYAKTGENIVITAEFENITERLIKAGCVLLDAGGRKIATAKGKFLPFSGDDAMKFKKKF